MWIDTVNIYSQSIQNHLIVPIARPISNPLIQLRPAKNFLMVWLSFCSSQRPQDYVIIGCFLKVVR
jgi:hypothetical protein